MTRRKTPQYIKTASRIALLTLLAIQPISAQAAEITNGTEPRWAPVWKKKCVSGGWSITVFREFVFNNARQEYVAADSYQGTYKSGHTTTFMDEGPVSHYMPILAPHESKTDLGIVSSHNYPPRSQLCSTTASRTRHTGWGERLYLLTKNKPSNSTAWRDYGEVGDYITVPIQISSAGPSAYSLSDIISKIKTDPRTVARGMKLPERCGDTQCAAQGSPTPPTTYYPYDMSPPHPEEIFEKAARAHDRQNMLNAMVGATHIELTTLTPKELNSLFEDGEISIDTANLAWRTGQKNRGNRQGQFIYRKLEGQPYEFNFTAYDDSFENEELLRPDPDGLSGLSYEDSPWINKMARDTNLLRGVEISPPSCSPFPSCANGGGQNAVPRGYPDTTCTALRSLSSDYIPAAKIDQTVLFELQQDRDYLDYENIEALDNIPGMDSGLILGHRGPSENSITNDDYTRAGHDRVHYTWDADNNHGNLDMRTVTRKNDYSTIRCPAPTIDRVDHSSSSSAAQTAQPMSTQMSKMSTPAAKPAIKPVGKRVAVGSRAVMGAKKAVRAEAAKPAREAVEKPRPRGFNRDSVALKEVVGRRADVGAAMTAEKLCEQPVKTTAYYNALIARLIVKTPNYSEKVAQACGWTPDTAAAGRSDR